MNSLLVLLVATSATAADPQPWPVTPATPRPAVTYAEPGGSGAQEGRPRLFGKVRNFVSRKRSQLSDRMTGSTPTPDAFGGPGAATGVLAPVPSASPQPSASLRTSPVRGDSSPEPPLADPLPSRAPTALPAAPGDGA